MNFFERKKRYKGGAGQNPLPNNPTIPYGARSFGNERPEDTSPPIETKSIEKHKVTLYFKNGATITVICDGWENSRNVNTGRFTKLILENPRPFVSIELPELMAFTDEVEK